MAVATAPPDVEVSARRLAAEYVQEEIDHGADLREAAATALRRLTAEGLRDALLDEVGTSLVMDIWRHATRSGRATLLDTVSRGAAAETAGEPGGVTEPTRIPTSFLAGDAIYGLQFAVGPRQWVTLGEMRAADCRHVRRQHITQARAQAKFSHFFRALERRLKEGETVRQAVPADEVTRLYLDSVK